MKFLCAVSCIVCAVSCFVSCSYGKTNERYRLYPTQNMWTFLKLDTATGKLCHVQYGIEDGRSFEYALSDVDISACSGRKQVNGRYKLHSTQNHWNFLLLDTLDGDVYQVRWGEKCGILPICRGIVKRDKSECQEPEKTERENRGSLENSEHEKAKGANKGNAEKEEHEETDVSWW